ncbi:hypothetical protein CQA66_08770 [Helicobacter aurati]|uniref:Uncharacterized protein n=1 Tax=Helicobacter aurati TaxID=137778 RepID=A0A3D8IY36_9HELI|nr:hypothetical protein [Helicobacter aurati]RDU69825.1 hypothetical protein CQA66_08770 [Helicobacter aurati]
MQNKDYVILEIFDFQVIIYNDNGNIIAFNNTCPLIKEIPVNALKNVFRILANFILKDIAIIARFHSLLRYGFSLQETLLYG